MSEYRLFHKIPKRAEFHSVIMTTYSFDFYHFESQVLRTLKGKGITNVNVFCDPVMLDQSIGYAMGNLKEISTSYSVNSISSIGAFHPKVSLFAGDNHVMLLQGSGNITTGGHGKNHEIFSVFYADIDNKEQLPLIQEAWHYIKSLTKGVKGLSSEKLNWVSDNCSLLKEDPSVLHQFHSISNEFSAALLYNDETSILQQLKRLIPKSTINRIKIFSPFYDENGSTIEKLLSHFDNSKADLFLQNNKGIHPYKMNKSDRISFYSWDSTNRVKDQKKDRKLHAKILWFESDNEHYCLLGSANATNRAFGDASRGANDEFSVLVRVKDDYMLEELQLNGSYELITPQDNKKVQEIENKNQEEQSLNSSKIKLLSVDFDGKILTFYSKSKDKFESIKCIVYDKWGEILFASNLSKLYNKIEIELPSNISNRSSYIVLLDSNDQPISNKQIINNLNELWGTNPSIENRKLMKLGSFIEEGRNGFFDIIDFYNILNISKQKKIKQYTSNTSDVANENDIQNASGLTYDEAINIDKESDEFHKIIKQHSTIKIWDAFEKYFNTLSLLQAEEDMDDEEEGDASIGREREEKQQVNNPIPLNSEKVLLDRKKKLSKFFGNYHKSLKRSCETEGYQVSLIDFAMYLIVLKQIVDFVNRKVIFKVDSDIKDPVILPVLGNLTELNSFSGALLNLLGGFINLLNHASLFSTSDEYLTKKKEHYIKVTRRSSLFCLAIAKQSYSYDKAKVKWFDSLAYSTFLKLGYPEENLNNLLEEFVTNSNLQDVSLESILNQIEKWKNEYKELKSNEEYFISDQLGVCYINKSIPNSGLAKFLRLSRPGFEYDLQSNDFELEKLYDVKANCLRFSKQKHNRSI